MGHHYPEAGITVYTDWSELSEERRAAFEQMAAELEADRQAENEARESS